MRYAVLSLVVFALFPHTAQAQPHGLRVPPGFEVTEFAGPDLANDIHCMTIDARGRILVSGRGYLRWLVDDNGDGKADRAVELAKPKDGAHGLLWEGDTLFAVVDGGLRRFRLKDDKVVGPSELVWKMKTGGEHHAHAVKRGPDGWLYVMCGNDTGIDKSYANVSTSPIRDPIAGCLIRFSPDFKRSEIVADGFRNAYDFDFNLDGEPFTFDSDNERCVSLPWYEGCRFYHVLPGGHYGWRSPQLGQFWRCPPYFADVVAPLDDLGRGSPTGVACYRHTQFPKEYHDGFFLCDWTFGRVYHVALSPKGATYAARTTVFLQSQGDNGFAPTAAAVHPKTGDLYVSIGGRGTRGAVYRIRHTERFKQRGEGAMRPMAARSLEWEAALDKELKRNLTSANLAARRRALEDYRRQAGRLPPEALVAAIGACWEDDDQILRQAAARLLVVLDSEYRLHLFIGLRSPRSLTTVGLAFRPQDWGNLFELAFPIAADDKHSVADRIAAVRLMQLALGDLTPVVAKGSFREGFLPGNSGVERLGGNAEVFRAVGRELKKAFPSGNAILDRELARTIAMAPAKGLELNLSKKVAEQLGSNPVDNLHYLMVLACLPETRDTTTTKRTALAILALDQEMAKLKMRRDNNWAPRVSEMYAALAEKDKNLRAAVIGNPNFGRPDHVLFTRGAAPALRKKAAQTFIERSKKDKTFAWNEELVNLIAELPPEESLPVLRPLYGEAGLDAALLIVLARNPVESDRPKFVAGLASPQGRVLKASLDALEKLPGKLGDQEAFNAIRLGQQPDSAEGKKLAARLGKYLDQAAGVKVGTDRKGWEKWLAANHPNLAARLTNPDGVDVAGWEKRLAKIDFDQGDAERGKTVFTKANCAACHSSTQALGPDLQGIATRFSRADLFTAILQPSKDVPARYQTTVLETHEGKTYQGLVIYDAVDGTILQTGATATVRLSGAQIASRRVSPLSLMPPGLLDPLSDREIADLYAYLRGLGK